jgi:hypothetical protein
MGSLVGRIRQVAAATQEGAETAPPQQLKISSEQNSSSLYARILTLEGDPGSFLYAHSDAPSDAHPLPTEAECMAAAASLDPLERLNERSRDVGRRHGINPVIPARMDGAQRAWEQGYVAEAITYMIERFEAANSSFKTYACWSRTVEQHRKELENLNRRDLGEALRHHLAAGDRYVVIARLWRAGAVARDAYRKAHPYAPDDGPGADIHTRPGSITR